MLLCCKRSCSKQVEVRVCVDTRSMQQNEAPWQRKVASKAGMVCAQQNELNSQPTCSASCSTSEGDSWKWPLCSAALSCGEKGAGQGRDRCGRFGMATYIWWQEDVLPCSQQGARQERSTPHLLPRAPPIRVSAPLLKPLPAQMHPARSLPANPSHHADQCTHPIDQLTQCPTSKYVTRPSASRSICSNARRMSRNCWLLSPSCSAIDCISALSATWRNLHGQRGVLRWGFECGAVGSHSSWCMVGCCDSWMHDGRERALAELVRGGGVQQGRASIAAE